MYCISARSLTTWGMRAMSAIQQYTAGDTQHYWISPNLGLGECLRHRMTLNSYPLAVQLANAYHSFELDVFPATSPGEISEYWWCPASQLRHPSRAQARTYFTTGLWRHSSSLPLGLCLIRIYHHTLTGLAVLHCYSGSFARHRK